MVSCSLLSQPDGALLSSILIIVLECPSFWLYADHWPHSLAGPVLLYITTTLQLLMYSSMALLPLQAGLPCVALVSAAVRALLPGLGCCFYADVRHLRKLCCYGLPS